jgi:hypothetical protein
VSLATLNHEFAEVLPTAQILVSRLK